MTDTALQVTTPSGMELLAEEYRKNPSIELAKEIAALQISLDRHAVEMRRFQWEAEQRQDEIDFGEALSACQAEIGLIQPDRERKLKSGGTMNWFATYPHLNAVVRPIYIKHGFSISYGEIRGVQDGRVGVRATLQRGRMSRDYEQFITVAEGNQATTKSDLDASSSSRCMRYLLIKIFNIAVAIDKDEMAPFEDDNPLLLKIAEAHDVKELNRLSLEAIKEVHGDTEAVQKIGRAKNKRLAELKGESNA